MNGTRFETQFAPGGVVIFDSVASHKSERAAELERGAWLPPLLA